MNKLLKDSRTERAFLFLNEATLALLALIMLYPLVHTLAVSFSAGPAAEAGRVYVWPVGFQTTGWRYVVRDRMLHRAFLNSVYVTVVGVVGSLGFTALFAYPLSRSYFTPRKALSLMVVISLVIRYPLIPYFLSIRSYGLMNNIHVLIVTHLITEFNLIIMRTFFQGLPDELEEAALMEGANHLHILVRIIIPLSKPVFATLALFFAVNYWNMFLHPLMFLRDANLMPIQIRLRQFIAQSAALQDRSGEVGGRGTADLNRRTIEAAVTIFATLPILMLYPFLQRHFVKGALLGSVKG